MKFTLSWLKDYLETDASLEEIVDHLNARGFEVEKSDDKSYLRPFLIAKIISAEKHPDADRLQVLQVDLGQGKPVQVICGAPNARAGLIGVFAAPETYVPGLNITLKVAKIRGVESYGMMCSENELCLSKEHAGIIELDQNAPIGKRFSDYAGLDDPVIEVNITVNRSDATGVYGLARDLAAGGIGKLKSLQIKKNQSFGSCPVKVHTEKDIIPERCYGFALRMVRGVRNKQSPEWLQKRLRDIGLNPINALVDVTNYMTFTYGYPLHVFDAHKINGDLTLRYAQDGEKILTLDHKEHILSSQMCILADKKNPVSIVGIMGGSESGCSEETKDVLIESALWEPLNIARTGRALNIITDARYRFERGVDPEFMLPGLEIATSMILDFCGGQASEIHLLDQRKSQKTKIAFPLAEVHRLTGLRLSRDEIITILERLGFHIEDREGDREHSDLIYVTPPSWRHDITGKEDLVEEVMRIHGVDKIAPEPLKSLSSAAQQKPLMTTQPQIRLVKHALAAQGMTEAITWSFISEKHAKLFGGGHPSLTLGNPVSRDMSHMRPSLLPGLMVSASRNANHGFSDVALFEVSCVYQYENTQVQRLFASGIRYGFARPGRERRSWSEKGKAVDVFDAKSDSLALLHACGVLEDDIQIGTSDIPSWWYPGRSGGLQLNRKIVGFFGEFHPDVVEGLGASGSLSGFEIFLDALPFFCLDRSVSSKKKAENYTLHPIKRDFSFVVDKKTQAAEVVNVARSVDKKFIKEVFVFDVFLNQSLGLDKKSIGIEVTIQPIEKTLTEDDLQALSIRIIDAVNKKTGGILRG